MARKENGHLSVVNSGDQSLAVKHYIKKLSMLTCKYQLLYKNNLSAINFGTC